MVVIVVIRQPSSTGQKRVDQYFFLSLPLTPLPGERAKRAQDEDPGSHWPLARHNWDIDFGGLGGGEGGVSLVLGRAVCAHVLKACICARARAS